MEEEEQLTNSSSSDVDEETKPLSLNLNEEELEDPIKRSYIISNSARRWMTEAIIDKYTERFPSGSPTPPSQINDSERDEIGEPFLQETEDDNHDSISQSHHSEEEKEDNGVGPSLSLYEAVKKEGYVIPPTAIIEGNNQIQQVYICSEEGCDGRFSKRAYLEQHMCIHTSERPFVCVNEGCNKNYKRKDHLNRHVKYCPLSPGGGLPPVTCTEEGCNRTFINNTNLRKHIQVYHENKKKRIQTLLATYSDVVKSDRYNNDRLKEVEKDDRETENENTSPDETHHPKLDLSSKTPFGCPHPGCGMSFKWMNRLRRHMKVHEGYTCPECGEKFEKWPQLVKHKTAAHKEPQKCPLCQRTFAQGQWLKRHMKVHSDVREMYLCPYEGCKRCYSEKRNLDAHIRSYHDKQRFYCVFEDCGRSFAFKHKMLEHLKMHCNITDPL